MRLKESEDVLEKEEKFIYKSVEYSIITEEGKIKILYNDFEIDSESPLYKEILKNFQNNGENIDNEIRKNSGNIENLIGIYDIEDLKDNINIVYDLDSLKFYYDDKLIGVVEFYNIENNIVFLDFIGTINAKKTDFEEMPKNVEKFYLEYFADFSENIKIKGLGKYIYKKFIEFIKNKNNIKKIKSESFNKKSNFIKEKLLEEGIIKRFYIDKDGFTIVEL